MNGAQLSKSELLRFFNKNKETLENWLKYKVASDDDSEIVEVFKEYEYLKKVSYIFISIFIISLIGCIYLLSLIRNFSFAISIIIIIVFLVTVPSFIISYNYGYKAIRLLVDVYPLYHDALETEKMKNIGEYHTYLNQKIPGVYYLFCPFCGKKIPSIAKFCPNCGKPI
ncbi:MAG: zinc ribbon domain-containing protein [Candidatus Helarchaeota archaeon]